MAIPTLKISPRVLTTSDRVRYEFELAYSTRLPARTLFYEFPRELAPQPPATFDGVLCAMVLHAMSGPYDIHLRGPASDVLLRNLAEFQRAWSRWLPSVYRPVAITVDDIVVTPTVHAGRSIAAFSGGVDSSFTLVCDTLDAAAGPRYDVDTVLMVHGFDVALANQDDMQELVRRTQVIRDRCGVRMLTVRTNSKELRLQKWEDSCGTQLAACLHLCGGEFAHALIASTEPYDALVLPWGTNPVTDHLLSGGQLAMCHHGAGFSRTEKMAVLARFPEALAALKVCWQGKAQGRNCGVCEKCVRTRLNLLAVGVVDPPCFDQPFDLRRVDAIPLNNDVVLGELRSIVDYAERQNLEAEWLRVLRRRVRRGKRNWTLRSRVRRSLSRAGLLAAARRLHRQLAVRTVE